jgi:competence protein ComEA
VATDPVATTGSPTPTAPAADATTAGKRAGSTVVVHVAGAVVTPGVVTLTAGSRVIDAVEAAGGALPNADLDRLNLAAKLVDGQRVLVQHVGDPPAAADPSTPADGAAASRNGPLDLNAASEADLDQLPGIGPSLAQAIIAERTRRGGFRSLNELREVRGIGERRFADLKSLVTV